MTTLNKANPPAHKPTLERSFAADPFDPRMHGNGATRDYTSLGLLVSVWHHIRTHPVPDMMPVFNSIDIYLRREAPDAIVTLERMYADGKD